MISRPEYTEAAKQLEALCQKYEDRLTADLASAKTTRESVNIARNATRDYHKEYKELLSDALAKSGIATATHYDYALGTKLTPEQQLDIVQSQLVKQGSEKYYGATLDQRLKASQMNNLQRIERSAHVGASLETKKLNLARVFLHTYPFGAQIHTDQRLLLGQIVKLEHDIATTFAKEAKVEIIKWELSHRHVKKDICDKLATDIDPNVVKWLKKRKIRISAKGLYFVDKAPVPPHPNCQCHLRMLKDKELAGGPIRRSLGRIRELLGNLLQRP